MTTSSASLHRRWVKRLVLAAAGLALLFVLYHIEENWRGRRAWAAYRGELEAKGVKLDLKAHLPPRVPDDQNFAMTPFLAPLQDFDPATGRLRETAALKRAQEFGQTLPAGALNTWRSGQWLDLVAWRDALAKPASGKPAEVAPAPRAQAERAAAAPAVLTALQPYEPVLDELRRVSQRPHCRFNLNYDIENPAAILVSHVSPLRSGARILAIRASAALAAGQTTPAMADVELMFHLAGATKNDFLIGHLVAIAIAEMAVQPIWEGLADHRWSSAQLQLLQEKLQRLDFLAGAWRALQVERAGFGSAMFDFLRSMPRRKLLTTLRSLTTGGAGPDSLLGGLLFRAVPEGWLYFEQLNYHRAFEERLLPIFEPGSRRIYPQRAARTDQALGRMSGLARIWHHRVLVDLLLPAVGGIARKSASAQTTADEAAIACALERCRSADGKFPEMLAALTPRFFPQLPRDTISGQPLQYRREGEHFRLYSVGWNERDDGGVPGTKSAPASDDGDWVWPAPPSSRQNTTVPPGP